MVELKNGRCPFCGEELENFENSLYSYSECTYCGQRTKKTYKKKEVKKNNFDGLYVRIDGDTILVPTK